jgi:periplasmic protein TonB
MNHLSSEQIDACLIGQHENSHAIECAACRAEMERIAGPLHWFRASMRDFADRQMSHALQTAAVFLLTPESLDRAWYSGILNSIKEAIHSRDLPPLQVTSSPIEVPSVWGFMGGHERAAGAMSVLVHCAVVAMLFVLGSMKPVQKLMRESVTLIAPDLKPYLPEKNTAHGGGGGGARSPMNASAGKLPKIAPRQFTPPRVDALENPKLPMTPTIVAEMQPPDVNLPDYGDPLSRLGVPSNGTGIGGGIGSGMGGGVGSGRGAGVGPGSGGGFGGGAYKIGGGVSPPTVLSMVNPEYSEEARKAKWQGDVMVQVVVDEHGMPRQMRVIKSLGLGLDEKALEAVAKWRFKPGMKDGRPVPVVALIDVTFHLL